MSMFMKVRAAKKMNRKNIRAKYHCVAPKSVIRAPLSGITPSTISVYIDPGTELKLSCPTSVPSVKVRMAIAKTAVIPPKRTRVIATDRIPTTVPLIKIISSGMARSSRTIRAMRVRRSKRSSFKIDASPNLSLVDDIPSEPSITLSTVYMIQVSVTIKHISTLSNTNQESWRAVTFRAKAPKRIVHSKAKYAQKRCSAIWNRICASGSETESL
mmetsp:Transcript_86162/g.157689  ORF Transcript_86162/g.157689 Transcript_86162/m.157689 type:complete len:214 (+) Transcript_86162:1119-1760(+)